MSNKINYLENIRIALFIVVFLSSNNIYAQNAYLNELIATTTTTFSLNYSY